MNAFRKSKDGYMYIPTDLGLSLGNVRAKFDGSSMCSKQYKHNVPTSWVLKGYVKEIKEDSINE